MKGKVVIAGASGFIGRHLRHRAEAAGFTVVPLNRGGSEGLQWDGKTLGPWVKGLEGAAAVVNLVGAPINGRWTEAYKKELVASRIEPTALLGKAIAACENPPQVWVNGSAVGYYGEHADQPVDESAPAGDDFLATLCVDWERAILESGAPCRKSIVRTGFVLGTDGGAFPILLKLTKAFFGGAVGSGVQSVPWIHIGDLADMFFAAATDPIWPQVVNGTAPHPVTNAQLMAALRRVIGRPWAPSAPALAMRAITGLTGISAPSLALASQHAIPKAAIDHGFTFGHPQIEAAILDLVKKS